jgi:hypothetical protein
MVIAGACKPAVVGFEVQIDGKEGYEVGNQLPREGQGLWDL